MNVKGNTDLKGGVISSTQAAIDAGTNSLRTGTLTTSDIQNRSTASAKSSAIDLNDNMFSEGKYGIAKAILGNALNNGSASSSASGTTKSAVSAGNVVITDEAGQQAATGKNASATIAALNRDTSSGNGIVQRQDLQSMREEAQAEQTLKNAGVKAITVYTDDAYKTMFKKEVKFYRVTCGGNTGGMHERRNAGEDGRDRLRNGQARRQDPRGQRDLQHAGAGRSIGVSECISRRRQNKPSDITLMHIAPADTTLGELLVATYEQKMASLFGYTNADSAYADVLQGRGQESTISMGHSRGTIVQTNAFNIAAENGYTNSGLSVEGVGIAVPVPVYIDAAGRVNNPDGGTPKVAVTYMTNDPVSVIAAGNPGDAMAAILEFYNVVKSSNSAHSCYGTGAIGCTTIANPVSGGPQPANQQPGNVVTYQAGRPVSTQGDSK